MKLSDRVYQNISACLGNLFEHYDTALFGMLSPFLAPLFFPQQDPITALILTYAMIPIGMLARPFGSIFFGYIGDKYGREKALSTSLTGMAVVSGLLAFCPTYTEAGLFAPIFLVAARIFQNFLAAGETVGGAIYCLENSSEKHHDLISSLFNASTIGGILLASAGVALLGFTDTVESGWRVLYLFGSLTGLFGVFIRTKVVFEPCEQSFSLKSIWECKKGLALIMLASGFSYANYVIALILMNGFIPLVTSFTKVQMASLNTSLLVFDFLALPLFGWISSKISREKLMFYSALLAALIGTPLFVLLEEATFPMIIFVRICLVLIGVAFFAPFHAWSQELIPKPHRYLTISFGYALGTQLLGGPTATISLWMYQQTGAVASIGLYWALLGLASGIGIFYASTVRQKANLTQA